jgi:hypothetical protein
MMGLEDKVLIISVRHVANDGRQHTDTFFAKVLAQTSDGWLQIQRFDGTEQTIPLFEPLETLESGFYELNDGSTCENPDYEMRLIRYESEQARETYHAII